jgi:hypothetical protein
MSLSPHEPLSGWRQHSARQIKLSPPAHEVCQPSRIRLMRTCWRT